MLKTYLCRNGNQARNQPSDDGGGRFSQIGDPFPSPPLSPPWTSCSLHPGPWFTQPSIISWSVNEYRLRLGRFKEGICDAAWCAPCTWAPLQ